MANAADCTTPVANQCSLRDALASVVDGDTIEFASGSSGTITLTQGQLEVDHNILLQGPGAAAVTIDGAGASRIFYVCSSSGPATISSLTMTGGYDYSGGGVYEESCGGVKLREVIITGNAATSYGGGVYSNGDLWIYDSEISNNTAPTYGGGVYAASNLVMAGSTVSGNSTSVAGANGGGGIFASGDIDISTSTVDGNTSASCGGGLYVAGDSHQIQIIASTFSNNTSNGCYGGGIDIDGHYNTVLIANTTITGNIADGGAAGGGLHADYDNTISLFFDTIVGNTATSTDSLYSGGGLHLSEETMTMVGTIVSGNISAAGPADIGYGNAQYPLGFAIDADRNLVGEVDSRLFLYGAGNISSTAPGVGALADNGGPTRTMALDPTSPAVDAGGGMVPSFPGNAYDQRGVGYARLVGDEADLGAFEIQPVPEPTTTSTSTSTTSTTAGDDPVVPEFTG